MHNEAVKPANGICKTQNIIQTVIILIILFLLAGCCEENNFTKAGTLDTAWNDTLTIPARMADDAKNTIKERNNQVILLVAGGASVVMNQGADDRIEDHFERDIFHNITDRGLNFFGGPEFQFGAAGLWYLSSVNSGDEANRSKAAIMIRALALTDVATISLKIIRNNKTPADDCWGWPSGHTSTSFAAASVLDELYGPKVGIPAYAGASLVALRMMDQKDHWASDIVFGAALGWVIGHTVAGDKAPEIAGFKIAPCITSYGATGISLYKCF
jgi:hypothetical protein